MANCQKRGLSSPIDDRYGPYPYGAQLVIGALKSSLAVDNHRREYSTVHGEVRL